jgi:hypothetical protein
MNEQDYMSFLLALGEALCETLSTVVGDEAVVPQDGYEVFYQAFNQNPSPIRLAALTEADLAQLCSTCKDYFECQNVTTSHMHSVVSQTLVRWPANCA